MSEQKVESVAAPRLQMRGITKRFGGVHALEGVDLAAGAGEVHALCGENGAGKSTLMKILAGAITEYEGEIVVGGKSVSFAGPREAEEAGIRIIHQELNLVPELTVAANIFLGRELRGPLGLLDDRAMDRRCREVFEKLGAPISPGAKVSDLRIGDQQMVEIARALAFDAEILIMDEPTSALSDHEVTRLYRVIGDLRAAGTTVLYISHKMVEVFTLADRVTVLRDGRFVATAPREEASPEQVVRWMVGRELSGQSYHGDGSMAGERLAVRGLGLPAAPGSGRPSLRGISFEARAGEVVGIAGLLGAGRTELLEALFGAGVELPSGEIVLDGKPAVFRSPRKAIDAGVALVTEDRKNLGLFDQMTVGDNIMVASLREVAAKMGLVGPGKERGAVADSIARLGIKTRGRGAANTSLSGGNQQKCIVARWLLTQPKLLLLDEPTRGIDVGAKAEIYALIRQLAEKGMCVLMSSSELPELLAVCNRVLVLCEGRLTATLTREEATEEAIMSAATRFEDRAVSA
jgi:ABC-type sugar transport system ATPase subunit